MQDRKHRPQAQVLNRSALSNGVSRRDFLHLNAALIALAGTSSCQWHAPSDDNRQVLRIVRADDLLSFTAELHNLAIIHKRRRNSQLKRIDPDVTARLVIQFAGQHVAEQTLPERADTLSPPPKLPVGAQIAQPTRLVFEIPSSIDAIELTIDALLRWQDWLPVWPGQSAREVSADASMIELPAGLALSPDIAARWAHATQPVTYKGRTELWHTRLVADGGGTHPSVSILHPGYPTEALDALDPSLGEEERRVLIGKNARARTLILSPMGGWLDLYGKWTSGPIARWEHRAAAGQDQKVVIQRKEGFLFPFGHRATLITVTERKLDNGVALLRKRDFIVIKQVTMTYVPGEMALRELTAKVLVTPPLTRTTPKSGPFWVETAPGTPHLFRFSGEDWAKTSSTVEAIAVFVTEKEDIGKAQEIYSQGLYAPRRTSQMQGQSIAVASFASQAHGDKDGWGNTLPKPRSAGDTTLRVLQFEFGADTEQSTTNDAPFSCRTTGMQVRIPSLDPYLNDQQNQGWFDYLNPEPIGVDTNMGEVFAKARTDEGTRIPMAFDQQADRCGGVATPSFDVDGISRVFGPIGDADSLRRGQPIDTSNYFSSGAALLGGFDLTKLLPDFSQKKSPAIPNLFVTISRKEPKPTDKPGKKAEVKLETGLRWKIPLEELSAGIVSFVPKRDENASLARLALEVKGTKVLKKSTDKKQDDNKPGSDTDEKEASKGSPIQWTISGKVTNFAIEMSAFDGAGLSVAFKHLGVSFSPATKKPKDPEKTEDKKEEKKPNLPEIDYEIEEIRGSGALSFLNPLIAIASRLPEIPDWSFGEGSIAYPAKLPDVGDADLKVTIGPIEAPKFKWLQFEVSNVSATVGIGLYFFPRDDTGVVPDHLFTVRLASAEKPLTLLAEPWGGFAHVAFNFTTKRLTGFQCGIGILYRVSFNFGVGEALCEGSLTGIYTYEVVKDHTTQDITLILKLVGRATIAGWIEVNLMMVAIGNWNVDRWEFYAEISVRVKISFFAISISFKFSYALENGNSDRMLASNEDDLRLTEAQWLDYRSAFAEVQRS